jgi:GNAT superfamily N-acetyltransferase
MLIRELSPDEAPLVAAFYRQAPDYWLFAEGRCEPDRQAQEFFTDAPPGLDPGQSHHLGLFLKNRLSGVAELSFGFPEPTDAYLGLMLLGPWAQGQGHGRTFLTRAETLARARGVTNLYLAVLEANHRGRAFWEREGFRATGLSRIDPDTGHTVHRLVKDL